MVPNPWAWRSHAPLALQLRDRLRTKASGGAGRAKASVIQGLGNRDGSPASLGQHLDLMTDLRIGTQLAQLANWSDHDSLGVASADPLNTYIHRERSIGHQDPGATSSWLILKTLADTLWLPVDPRFIVG